MSKLSTDVTKHDHLQGDPDAARSLVEYGDHKCPSCADMQPTVRCLQAHFGDQMSFVFRNFSAARDSSLGRASGGGG